MNFHLISIALLMMPLVFADQSPDVYTYLYDSDFVIAEAYGRLRMVYSYNKANDELSFLTRNHTVKYYFRTDEEVMTLVTPGQDFKNQNLSFAVEFSADAADCRERSSPNLRHLIKSCTKRTAIRELTEQEKAKLQDYKAEQKENGERFEFVYERVGKKNSRSKSTGIRELKVAFYEADKPSGPPHPGSPFSAIASSRAEDSEWFNEVRVTGIDELNWEHEVTLKDFRTSDWGRQLKPITIKGLGDTSPGVSWRYRCRAVSSSIRDVSMGCTGLTKVIGTE